MEKGWEEHYIRSDTGLMNQNVMSLGYNNLNDKSQ